MQKTPLAQRLMVLLKIAGIIFIALVLLVPLTMVRGLISERAAAKDSVVADIARTAADAQRLTLPVLVVPYTRRWIDSVETIDAQMNKRIVNTERVESGSMQFLPEQVQLKTEPALESKHRGLYEVLTYTAGLNVSGRFVIPKDYGYVSPGGTVTWGAPVLAFGVSDPRGIKNNPVLNWGGSELRFQPGTGGELTRLGSGISASLPVTRGEAAQDVPFSFTVNLSGMERISFIPTGRETRVSLDAPWAHPSFFGKFSPESRIGGGTFSANWQTSFFSANARQAYATCVASAKCEEFNANEFGVSFIQPANLYLQLERAAKYGFLFVGLTFAAFFLFEVLKSMAVHPLQYGLVGLALAMFFLLLVSLSEHIGFAPAYAVASCACVGLIVVYLAAVLGNWWRALSVGGLLAGLYGVLFMLLRSEDYALLMGSLFLFVLLGGVMLGTRRINWYNAGRREPAEEVSAAA
jgi:inner membrane protein